MNKTVKNIITFGAHNRIQNQKKDYDSVKSNLQSIYNEMEDRKPIVNKLLIKAVEEKKKALVSLQDIKKITKNIKGKDREFFNVQIGKETADFDLDYVNDTLKSSEVLFNASKGAGGGIGTGVLTSTAVPYLVGQLATASTGTAISSLTGAAASNATLAWLGGGSIATGGGGMAVGTAVLGGLTFGIGIVTALGVTTIFNHLSANKEIKIIKEKELEAVEMIDQITKNLLAFELIEKRCSELETSLKKSTELFNTEFVRTYKKIFRIPVLTKMIKQIKKLFGRRYFNDNDLKEIQYLGGIAKNFAQIIDTKIIENEEEIRMKLFKPEAVDDVSKLEKLKRVSKIIPRTELKDLFSNLAIAYSEDEKNKVNIATIDAKKELLIRDMDKKYDLYHKVFYKIFDERGKSVDKSFDIIDKGLKENDKDLISMGLTSLSKIVSSSPFGDIVRLSNSLEGNSVIEI